MHGTSICFERNAARTFSSMNFSSTSVDPNVFGGMMILLAALGAPQIAAERPIFPRWLSVIMVGTMVLALVLTFSRGTNAASYFPRYMASGGNLLGYNIYDDAANTNVLGDGSGGTTRRVPRTTRR